MSYLETLVLYSLIIFLSVVLTKIAYQRTTSKGQKKVLICIVIFLLAFFAGLRYETGADWRQYYIAVEYVGKQGHTEWGDGKNNYGLLYIALCKIVYWIGGNGICFLFLMAFLTYLFLFLVLDRYKDKIEVHIGVFLYTALYYLVSYNIVRQALAITIGMYAISFLDVGGSTNIGGKDLLSIPKKKKSVTCFLTKNSQFIFWAVVATLMHNSGVICFFAWPLCYMMKRKRIKWLVLIAMLAVVLNFKILRPLAQLLSGFDSASVRFYFALWGEGGSYLKYFIRYVPFLIACGMSYDAFRKDQKMMSLYNLFIIGVIGNMLSIISNSGIERVIFTYLYMLVIVVPFGLKNMYASGRLFNIRIRFNTATCKAYRAFLYLFVIATFYYIFFLQGQYSVVPYKFNI